ncbi:MAG: hypothetical protein GX345_06630 [Clostridiales bacterium]|nr:hypothetical protein [Clostridiales bacterium]
MEKLKKVLKIVGIIMAVAAAVAGVYLLVTKLLERKESSPAQIDYVSCSCLDEEEEEE